MYTTITIAFNLKRVTLLVAVACMLLSVFAFTAQPVSAQTQEEESEDTFVSEELVEKLERLQELVEQLVVLVEQVRGNRDTGSAVSQQARSVGDGIVRVFVGNDLESIRYRENRDEALSVCMDSVQLSPRDEGYGTQSSARCTYNGETIYSGGTQDMEADGSHLGISERLGSGSSPDGGLQACAGGSFRYDEVGNLVCEPLENYALESDSDDGSEPDFFVRESSYNASASNVTINYALENDGASYVGYVDTLVEIDASCDEEIEFRSLFTTSWEGGSLNSGQHVIGSDGGSIDELVQNDGCYRLYVDYPEDEFDPDDSEETDGDITESDEDNNRTNWLGYGGTSDITNES